MLETVSVVRVIASCAIVCGLAWALGVWLRRLQPIPSSNQRRLRLLEILHLGGGKSLALVAYQHRKFIIALTPQSVQLLTEVSEDASSEIRTPHPAPRTHNGWDGGRGTRDEMGHVMSAMFGMQDGWRDSEAKRNSQKDSELSEHEQTSHPASRTPHPIMRRFLSFLHSALRTPHIVLVVPLLLVVFASFASSQSQAPSPQTQLSLMRESVQILMVLTLIALAPFLLAVMTCFTRIVIVLSLLRVAMGTPQTPPNPVVIGMALFLTLFVMAPTLQEANEKGLQPFLRNEISLEQAIAEGYKPFQRFMLRQVREKDIALFLRIAKLPNPKRPEDVPAYILIPAFVLSEVRTGFEIGFLLAVPFLVLDLVVASVLMGMGMLMVPPMLISLPLKLLLFVLADGWHLLMKGLALSVR
ncbi:flagellar type III secretion system pore protein FliP [Fervidibacter sp.]|jgi:flagellar biosynthetic protein FliP